MEGGGDGEREGKAEEVGLIYEKGLLRRAPALFAWMGGFAACFWIRLPGFVGLWADLGLRFLAADFLGFSTLKQTRHPSKNPSVI